MVIDVPDDVCGFTLQPEDVGEVIEDLPLIDDLLEWYESRNIACCTRPPWRDEDRCIWHAEVDGKPTDDLVAARGDGPEHLDGAFVVGVELEAQISFDECRLRGANLSGTDLTGASLFGADLKEANLREANLRAATLPSADLSRTEAQRSDLPKVNLIKADLSGANLKRANLSEASLSGGDLSEANLFRTDLSGARLAESELPEANLQHADLPGVTLYRGDLSGADLRGANLSGANLKHADLPETNLRRIILSQGYLYGADLSGASLKFANLSGANLKFAKLSKANLRESDLSKADLQSTDLRDADLGAADISGAFLRGADLSETNLIRADLVEADLKNADLSDSTLTNAVLTSTDLQNATLNRAVFEETLLANADCRDANFQDARYYQAVFRDTRINSKTHFVDLDGGSFGQCDYEQRPDNPLEDYDQHPYEAAAWTYRRLEVLHEQNAISDRARQFHIRKQEAQRKNRHRRAREMNWNDREKYLLHARAKIDWLNYRVSRHGESLGRITATSGLIILGSGLLYPFLGGVEDAGIRYCLLGQACQNTDILANLGRGLYFSIITFTTIGYANVAPQGTGSRVLVGIESLAGALLIALFIFVLGRQVNR
ncbi:pentapeptide repeat-containing protein [Haloarchaeobius sp. DYHT-AS-18]|uniref:pentapeptide repeat-containing protein n=1 Tax=Haloarchaeobius sp. DYHT-AS-18 TaxID=3446117 RepID=UPI003EBDEF6B